MLTRLSIRRAVRLSMAATVTLSLPLSTLTALAAKSPRHQARPRSAASGAPAVSGQAPALSPANCEATFRILDNSADEDQVRDALVIAIAQCKETPEFVGSVAPLVSSNHALEVRREAAIALADRTDSRAVGALTRTLQKDKSSEVRLMAASSLVAQGADRAATLQALAGALRSDEAPEVRAQVAQSLGRFAQPGDADIRQVLQSVAKQDAEASVRAAALNALRAMASGAIASITASKDAAAPDLRDLRDDARVEAMLDSIEDSVRNDADIEVRSQAAIALAELGPRAGKSAAKALAKAFASDFKTLNREQPQFLATLAYAMGKVGYAPSVDALVDAIEEDWEDLDIKVRGSAIIALAEIASPDATHALKAELERPDAEIRLRAALALAATADGKDFTLAVDTVMKEAEAWGRESLANILARPKFARQSAANATLRRLLEVFEPAVLAATLDALAKNGDAGSLEGLLTFIEESQGAEKYPLDRAFVALKKLVLRAQAAGQFGDSATRVADSMRSLRGQAWKKYSSMIQEILEITNTTNTAGTTGTTGAATGGSRAIADAEPSAREDSENAEVAEPSPPREPNRSPAVPAGMEAPIPESIPN